MMKQLRQYVDKRPLEIGISRITKTVSLERGIANPSYAFGQTSTAFCISMDMQLYGPSRTVVLVILTSLHHLDLSASSKKTKAQCLVVR